MNKNGTTSEQEKVMTVSKRVVNATLMEIGTGHQKLKLAVQNGSLENGVLLARNDQSFKLQLRAQMLFHSTGATYGMHDWGKWLEKSDRKYSTDDLCPADGDGRCYK
jgi:hypothetical protein